MKFSALLLIVCIVFLSSFSGSEKSLPIAEKANCCAKTAKNAHCSKVPKKEHQENNCKKQCCNIMLTCCTSAFLAVEPVIIQSSVVTFIDNPVPTYKTGNSAAYLSSDWKPPKV